MSKKKKQENIEKPYRKKLIKKRKPNRSIWGDIFLYLFLAFVALVMAFPIIYAVSSALKPLDELFKFPPQFWQKILPWIIFQIYLLPWENHGCPFQGICLIRYSLRLSEPLAI